MDLLHLCLTSTYFQYNCKHYKQLHGTAMASWRLRRTTRYFSRFLGNTRKQHPTNHCLQETNTHCRLLYQTSYNPTSLKGTTVRTSSTAQIVCDSHHSLTNETKHLNTVCIKNNYSTDKQIRTRSRIDAQRTYCTYP